MIRDKIKLRLFKDNYLLSLIFSHGGDYFDVDAIQVL